MHDNHFSVCGKKKKEEPGCFAVYLFTVCACTVLPRRYCFCNLLPDWKVNPVCACKCVFVYVCLTSWVDTLACIASICFITLILLCSFHVYRIFTVSAGNVTKLSRVCNIQANNTLSSWRGFRFDIYFMHLSCTCCAK